MATFVPYISASGAMWRRSTIVISALVLVCSVASGQTSSDQLSHQAHVAVQNKQYKSALALFRQQVEENPNDLEARVWVARLQSWQKDYAVAERDYRDVLNSDPANVEAELGLIDVLSWQKHYIPACLRVCELRNAPGRRNSSVSLCSMSAVAASSIVASRSRTCGL